jgi:hypothetical protein
VLGLAHVVDVTDVAEVEGAGWVAAGGLIPEGRGRGGIGSNTRGAFTGGCEMSLCRGGGRVRDC